MFLVSYAKVNQLPKPSPIQYGLPDEPAKKFKWKKINRKGDEEEQFSKRRESVKFNFDEPLSSDRQYEKPHNIYYHNFGIQVQECLMKYEYELIHNIPQLAKSLQFTKQTITQHPEDYEVFGNFEGSNIYQIYYCKYDIVRVILRSDTNSLGYCKQFQLGLKIINPIKELRITIIIMNLRIMLNDTPQVYVFRQSDSFRYTLNCMASQSKVPRRKYQLNVEKRFYFQQQFTYVHRSKSTQEVIYFSSAITYSYSTLKSKFPKWAHQDVKINQIGQSRLNIPIYCITITDQSKQAPVPLIDRRNILIMARCRPSDSLGNLVVEDIIQLLQENVVAKNLFKFILIPMVNPDGVLLGNSRCNVSGRDLSRQFMNPNNLCPETQSIVNMDQEYFAVIELRDDQIRGNYIVSNNNDLAKLMGINQRNNNTEKERDISNIIQSKYYAKIFLKQYQNVGLKLIEALQTILGMSEEWRSESVHKSQKLLKVESRKRFKSTESPTKKRSSLLIHYLRENVPIVNKMEEIEYISFKSESDHDDDMLDPSYFNNEVDNQNYYDYGTDKYDLFKNGVQPSRPSNNMKEQEIINQLRNIEWKDTHRSFDRSIGMKTPTKSQSAQQIKFKTTTSTQKSTTRTQSQANLYKFLNSNLKFKSTQQSPIHFNSESRYSESPQSRIIIKNPFIKSRNELFKMYGNQKKCPTIKPIHSFTYSGQVVTYQSRIISN